VGPVYHVPRSASIENSAPHDALIAGDPRPVRCTARDRRGA